MPVMSPFDPEKAFSRKLAAFCALLDRFAGLALLFMMVLTAADVVLRKCFSRPVLGAVELTQMLMVVIVYFPMARTENEDGHVGIDFIYGRLPGRLRVAAALLTRLAALLVFAAVAASSVLHARRLQIAGELTMDLRLPVYPLAWLCAVGAGLLCAVLILRALRSLFSTAES